MKSKHSTLPNSRNTTRNAISSLNFIAPFHHSQQMLATHDTINASRNQLLAGVLSSSVHLRIMQKFATQPNCKTTEEIHFASQRGYDLKHSNESSQFLNEATPYSTLGPFALHKLKLISSTVLLCTAAPHPVRKLLNLEALIIHEATRINNFSNLLI